MLPHPPLPPAVPNLNPFTGCPSLPHQPDPLLLPRQPVTYSDLQLAASHALLLFPDWIVLQFLHCTWVWPKWGGGEALEEASGTVRVQRGSASTQLAEDP